MLRPRTDYLVICHSDTGPKEDIGIRELDLRDRRQGYFRCVYHFVIRRSGQIEHGRPWTEPAMSLHKWDKFSVAICLVGGQGQPAFEPAQVMALRDLIQELQEEYPEAQVKYHHELNDKIRDHGVDLKAHLKEIVL